LGKKSSRTSVGKDTGREGKRNWERESATGVPEERLKDEKKNERRSRLWGERKNQKKRKFENSGKNTEKRFQKSFTQGT